VLDVLVVGAGPAGRAVAAACGERGLRTRLLDPAPGRPWRASYGAWRDELPADLPGSVLAATVRGRAVAVTEHAMDREYAVFDVPALRAHLDQRLADAGVTVERGRAEPGALLSGAPLSGALPAAGLVIDAGGAAQPLAGGRTRTLVAAEQTAVGVIVPAELAAPLLSPGEALFMDWRQAGGPGNWPTFLYAIPLAGDRALLEETSLARRPGLDLDTLAARLRARLATHGIRPPADAPREVVRFPLDRPRHSGGGALGFGAAAPLTHPATGYQLAEALRLAPEVAGAVAGALGAGPGAALAAAEQLLWPVPARAVHRLRRRGLESLLRMPAARLPEFFEGFFRLPEASRRAYLSGRTDLRGTAAAMVGMFGRTGWPVRLRLIGSSLLVRAGPESTTWSNVE
jgi:lycopene beta-cyclase